MSISPKLTKEELQALVEGSSPQELRDLFTSLPAQSAGKKPGRKGKSGVPQTDDELHAWIVKNTGYNIPRVAVCEGHCSPFEPIADAFFNRVDNLLIMGSREGGKTLGVSILQYTKCELIDGHEGCTFGAIEPQAKKAYGYVKSFVHYDDNGTRKLKPKVNQTLRSETTWKVVPPATTGSKLEILVGTASGVNSPHPQTVHADELDLMEDEIYEESRNMSSSKFVGGKWIPAQDVITSTRKSMHGLMQKLINEVMDAGKKGFDPPRKLYAFCVYEAAAEVPNCQKAPDIERISRLIELGLDATSRCDCHLTVKGEWGEDVPRTMASVCRGRLFKSRGWMRFEDIKRKFTANSQAMWEAQMECTRPMADGLYLPSWTRERFTVTGWVPRPDLGNCWEGIDWGGSAESVVLMTQGPLRVPVSITGAGGKRVVIPIGSYVVFDETVEANIGATRLATKTNAREVFWNRVAHGFRITARFADMAGKQQRDDWREHNPPMRTVWYLKDRAFDPTVANLQELVKDGRYWVCSDTCSRHCDDIESWRQKDGREVHDEASHTMAASRYVHANVEMREKRRRKSGKQSVDPVVVAKRDSQSPILAGPDQAEGERNWRGMPRAGAQDWQPH